ncbi:MAG: ankyrin repeat domain-containing protein [Bryobacterales bacterium]|nr:ankyrin repeat domain-containing protein [Bryobacterales bacterium]
MKVKKVTKRMVPGMLIVAVLGFGQGVEVIGGSTQDRVPARLSALYENSRLHYELHRKHYDHALEAMVLAKDIDMVEETTGRTALGLAAKDESADAIDMVRPLVLRFGADPRIADAKGYTALHYAAAAGNLAVVKFLADHGGEVDAVNPLMKERRVTPLYMAYQKDRARIADFLKFRGADDFDQATRERLELGANTSAAVKELWEKRVRDLRKYQETDPQTLLREEFKVFANATEETLRAQGKQDQVEELQQFRERYLAALETTPVTEGISYRDYRDLVQEKASASEAQQRSRRPSR